MPRITVSIFLEGEAEKQKLIAELVKITKNVFCPLTGIIPLPKGSTEIIPDFLSTLNPVGGPLILILLHKKPERTFDMLKKSEKLLRK